MKSPNFLDNIQIIVVPINFMVINFIKFINSSAYKQNMVYLRAKKFKRKNDDKPRIYYYLVEASRQGQKVQQKVIRYLGTADTIAKDYEELEQQRKKQATPTNFN
jgi:hypothetical protein